MRPRMEEGGSRLQPPSVFMLTLSLIGIGCGDPEQLTLAAIRAINAADLVLIPRKGADKSDLAELRWTICAQVLSGDRPRLVEFDLPQRDASLEDYRSGVDQWHDAVAATWAKEIATHLSLSVKTVSTYRTRILQKLRLKTTADLIRYALSQQLVSDQPAMLSSSSMAL